MSKLYRATKDHVEFHITGEQVDIYRNSGYEVAEMEEPKKASGKKKGGASDDGGTADEGEGAPAAEAGAP